MAKGVLPFAAVLSVKVGWAVVEREQGQQRMLWLPLLASMQR